MGPRVFLAQAPWLLPGAGEGRWYAEVRQPHRGLGHGLVSSTEPGTHHRHVKHFKNVAGRW